MTTETKAKKAEQEVLERSSPPGEIVYLAVHREGEHELKRGGGALAWSGLAAGLSMGFSMIAQALLRTHLPEAPWQILVSKFGYTIGFLIVILGRQQLFTENTLTAILPLLKNPKTAMFLNVGRLWIIVLATNLVGGYAFAWVVGHSEVFDAGVRQACAQIGREAVGYNFGTTILRGVFAGWLIALMVWLLPFAESAHVWVIIIISYVVGLGGFSHIVAGGVDAFYLVATSEISFARCFTTFLLPTLIGNIIGGVSLVAALGHAQFMTVGRARV